MHKIGKAIGVICSAAFLVVLTTGPVSAAVKVFLLGGQSNMAGVGGFPGGNYGPADAVCPHPYNQIQTTVKFWNYGATPQPGQMNDPTVGTGWVSLQPGYGFTGDEFGPELSFGYRLHQLFPDDEIYLVKYGISSTDLANNWNPNGTGACYNMFKSRVNAAMQNLTAANKNPTIAGMIWMQGEGDAAVLTSAQAYDANLENLIATVRRDFSAPNMRFVIGRIGTDYDTDPPEGNAIVRNAEMAVASRVSNVACFSTDTFEKAYFGHYGTQGQIDLGIAFANHIVPEPSSMAMAAGALAGLAAYAWQKRR